MTLARYFATCARGVEPVLAGELRDLGAADVTPGRGGVHFAGDKALLYRANLWLRTAIRVLRPVLDAPVPTPEALYDAVRTIDWSRYLTPEHTLAVDANVRDSRITHSKYAALKTKDAICDQFVERVGRRPSVDVEEPMIGLNLHIHRDQAVLSLDSSGESLHKRGYRPVLTKAPLNEALAAALVLLTGWKGDTAFADPLCGSGTLPIEATWLALRRPPGLTRRRFGFQGWMDFDIGLWTRPPSSGRTPAAMPSRSRRPTHAPPGWGTWSASRRRTCAISGHPRALRGRSCATRRTASGSATSGSCAVCTARLVRYSSKPAGVGRRMFSPATRPWPNRLGWSRHRPCRCSTARSRAASLGSTCRDTAARKRRAPGERGA